MKINQIFARFYKMFARSSYLYRLLPALLAIALLFSFCKKDKKVLGTSTLPEEDALGAMFSDTSTIYTHTIPIDSIVSINDAIKFMGSNQDPVFGRTDVGLYTKFALPNNITNVSFGNDAQLVKAELKIAVRTLDFLGDYQSSLNYQLYEMKENIPADKFYFTNNRSLFNVNNLLGSYTGSFSVENGTLVVAIPLNHTYGSALLTHTPALINTTALQNTYKGFYVTCKTSPLNPVSQQGVIARFDLESPLSGLFLYYRNGPVSPGKETKTFRFTLSGSNVVRFNEVAHKFNDGATNLLNAQLAGDTTKGSEAIYLKGLGGTKVKFYIPYLTNYIANGAVAVSRAEIRFKVDKEKNGADGKYPVPPYLTVLAMDSLGRENYVYDQLNSIDFNRYDGNFNPETNEYIFNISRDVQTLFNGKKKNYGFYLVVADPDRAKTPRRDAMHQRVVLGGHKNTLYKPSFRITYAPIEKK